MLKFKVGDIVEVKRDVSLRILFRMQGKVVGDSGSWIGVEFFEDIGGIVAIIEGN